MHEARADRGGVEMPLREDVGDGKRVRDVGLARFAVLPEVRLVGVLEGHADAVDVGL